MHRDVQVPPARSAAFVSFFSVDRLRRCVKRNSGEAPATNARGNDLNALRFENDLSNSRLRAGLRDRQSFRT
jgi:hypothetical protein